ncbi:hypothetical protein PQX77_020205 [Marasmius sp. AFHP31]|nr:hypothetical protein PQX77_020205 [Marasmius sp. AFHP31]
MQASAVVEGKRRNAHNTCATPSYTLSGPSRKQVLVSFPRGGETPSLNLSLVTAMMGAALRNRGKSLKVLSTKPAYDSWSMSMSAVATTPEIEVIAARIREMVPSEFKNSLWVGLPTSTSYLKVLDVPYYSTREDRSPITVEEVIEQFRSSPLREDLGCISGKPRVVHNSSKSTTATVYFNVFDSQMGTRAKRLIDRQLHVFGRSCYIRAAASNPGTPICQRCCRWGHSANSCRAPQPRCPKCLEPHLAKEHRSSAGCCKGNSKATPLVPPMPAGDPCPHRSTCANCRGDHSAFEQKCPFWRHRFDREWIDAKYAEVHTIRNARKTSPNPHPVD